MIKAILIVLGLMCLVAFLPPASKAAPALNIRAMLASPVDLTVYSVDRKLVIGHAHFTVKEEGKTVEIIGSTRYGNGERDWERIILRYQAGNPLPVFTSFQSNFLAPDGSAQLMEKADAKSGFASCRWGSQFGDISYEDTLEFEPNAYAGAASIVPLQYALKTGGTSVHFQVFDCAPKPAIYDIDAKLDNGVVHWSFYPGELAKMGLTPDLGWLNLVARPFIPDISVWFDRNEDYQYVGTSKDRFYRGRAQVLVRSTPGHPIAADPAQQAPPSTVASDPAKASN